MKNISHKSRNGFTIIEVVLVLAVAGLIFLMVFVAVPALRRSQRNNQRKETMSRLLTAIQQYSDQNDGSTPFMYVPTNATIDSAKSKMLTFVNRYVDTEGKCTSDSYTNNGTGSIDLVTTNGISARYKFNNCSDQFQDPDGTVYGLDVRYTNNSVNGEQKQAVVLQELNTEGNTVKNSDVTHWITIYQSAQCSEKAGSVVFHGDAESNWSSSKQVNAIVYRLEGGELACVDNH